MENESTKLAPAICTQCGGFVEVNPSLEKAFCKYCGSSFFVEKAISIYNVQYANIERVESLNIHNNKRGAVESILNFVENQHDKKQEREDEEKRRLEEEKRRLEEESRKQEEQLPKLINQIVNKKYQQRNTLIMLGVIIVICYLFLFLRSRPTHIQEDHTGEAQTPSRSIEHKGDDIKEVINRFEERGFTNIRTEKLDDLVFGWFTKDGEVEKVSVDGDEDYSPDVWHPNDVEVLITYHTFPEKGDTNEAESSNEVTNKPQEEETPKPEQTDNSESDTMETIIDDQPLILTIENSEEFAEFISVKSEGDPFIKEFVSNNIGNTIVFEGNIAYMNNHGNYDTRYDILIYTGDYSETSNSGPIFKFEDVNVFDLNLSGDNIPDTIGMGLNITITAEIIEFRDQITITFLEPIKTEIR